MSQELISSLKRTFGVGLNEIFDGSVKEYNAADKTISVEIDEGIIIPGVKLRSVINDRKVGLLIVPSLGSNVVFAKIDGQSDYCVIMTESLDSVIVEIDNVICEIDSEGVLMKRNGISLADVFDDLISTLTNFKVNTPSGPSAAVMPDTLAQIEALEVKYKQVLK